MQTIVVNNDLRLNCANYVLTISSQSPFCSVKTNQPLSSPCPYIANRASAVFMYLYRQSCLCSLSALVLSISSLSPFCFCTDNLDYVAFMFCAYNPAFWVFMAYTNNLASVTFMALYRQSHPRHLFIPLLTISPLSPSCLCTDSLTIDAYMYMYRQYCLCRHHVQRFILFELYGPYEYKWERHSQKGLSSYRFKTKDNNQQTPNITPRTCHYSVVLLFPCWGWIHVYTPGNSIRASCLFICDNNVAVTGYCVWKIAMSWSTSHLVKHGVLGW